MTLVRSLVERECGFGVVNDYDLALCRLKCYKEDVYPSLTPNRTAADFNPSPPVFACRFCTTSGYEEILALANEDGKIALQDTKLKGNYTEPLEGTQAHCNAIFDIAWMPGELKLVTASGDHTARLWDVSRPDITQIDFFHAHTRSVKTAVFRYQDKAVFATGARDGAILVWDIRARHNDQPRPDNSILNAHSVGTVSNSRRRTISHTSRAQSITGLAFQDDFTLLSCAAGDGFIKVWDLRKNYTVHKKDPLPKCTMNYFGNSARNGFSSLLIDPARITVYASCMDNIIYAYNISSYNPEPISEFYGHQNCTYYVKTCLSPDGLYLGSGSSDECAYIWRTNKPGGPVVRLTGHSEEVTCVTWCGVGELKIVTCGDDSSHRVWTVGPEHREDNGEDQLHGRAECLLNKNLLEKLKGETTPTVSRRMAAVQERTPVSDTTPSATPGPSSLDSKTTGSNQYCSTGPFKRTYTQMIKNGPWTDGKLKKTVLSPIQENLETASKRPHLENRGARRLFSPGNDNSSTNYDNDSDEPSTSTAQIPGRPNGILFSPTLNLPNFVIDGTAPHLVQVSPEKLKENVDWLTKIRKERYEQKAAKSVQEKSCSPVAQTTPARRSSRSRSSEPQRTPKTPKASLLNFFKITGKECESSHCCESTNTVPPSTNSSNNESST